MLFDLVRFLAVSFFVNCPVNQIGRLYHLKKLGGQVVGLINLGCHTSLVGALPLCEPYLV